MTVIGHQSTWITGSRLYFKRDDDGVTTFPLIDLGVIQVASPQQNVETVTLKDGDGGRLQDFDEAITTVEETYEIVCSNLNNENLAFLFSSERPTELTQSAALLSDVELTAHAGHLLELKTAAGGDVYDVSNIIAVYDDAFDLAGTAATCTGCTWSAGGSTITSTDILTALGTPVAGDTLVILEDNLDDITNAGTWTIASTTANSITLEETLNGAQTSADLKIWADTASTSTVYNKGDDWSVYNLSRGLIECVSGGIIADGAVKVMFRVPALSGLRQIEPQSLKGSSIKGNASLYWSRSDFSEEHKRAMRISLTPSDAAFNNEDFSNFTLTAKVLVDLTSTTPAGTLTHVKGTVPDPA